MAKGKYVVYKVTFKRGNSLIYEPRYFTSLTKARRQATRYSKTASYVSPDGVKGSAVSGLYHWLQLNVPRGNHRSPYSSYKVEIWKVTGNSAKKVFREAQRSMVYFEGVIPAGV